jgi:hypothetical protein
MKHLLNDLSEEEKNRIREQHNGGKKFIIENFKKLVDTKLGDAKPYLNEEEEMKGAPQRITAKEGSKYTYSIANISDLEKKPLKTKGLTFKELEELVNDNKGSMIVVDIPGETRGWTASISKGSLILDMII